MNRPYIICHMMPSVDGRIDCAMTEHLPGVQEYYDTLDALNAPTRISGRVTAQLEMSKPGVFACDDPHPLEREGFFKAESAPGYEVVTDTRGTLLWDKPADGERPLLILTSCRASREYLDYLEGLNISWIACGGDKIDLARAAFLADGLLDEVSILVGAGIDGRGGMAAVFDGLPMDRPVTPLKLGSVQQYGTGAVWLRYHTEK